MELALQRHSGPRLPSITFSPSKSKPYALNFPNTLTLHFPYLIVYCGLFTQLLT